MESLYHKSSDYIINHFTLKKLWFDRKEVGTASSCENVCKTFVNRQSREQICDKTLAELAF